MLKIIKNKFESHILILDKLNKKIKFKRIFFLIANKKCQRGNHAHRKCIQGFFSVKGSFYIKCIYSNGKKDKLVIILSNILTLSQLKRETDWVPS